MTGRRAVAEEKFSSKSVKLINKLRVLQLLYWGTGETQLSMSNKLHLSSPTITQTLQQFKEIGLLIEGEEVESSGGRKPRLINFNYEAMHVLGVEIRKNHIDMVIINLRGDIVREATQRLTFENTEAYWECLNSRLHELIDSSAQISNVLGVGIAFPGEVSCNGEVIERATVLGLRNEPLHNIKRHIDFDVYIENGANTAGFGAVWRSHGINDGIYIIVTDNGIAGSLIIENKIFRGSKATGKAGAFGHMVLVPEGKQCFCGGQGCWSAYCALSNLWEEAGDSLDGFFTKVSERDAKACATWDGYLNYFAQALVNVRLGLDMDIVIGGKISKYLQPFLPDLHAKIHSYPALHDDKDFVSVDTVEGSAQAVGAALIFVDQLLSGRTIAF